MKKTKTNLRDNQVITLENVKELGEKFAMSALQNMRRFQGSKIESLYNGLLKDVFHFSGTYTDGYDIAQECICYLCNYINHSLGEKCINIYGKKDTIRLTCYKIAYQYIRKQIKVLDMDNIEDITLIVDEDVIKTPEDYTRVNKLIKALQLNKVELQILKGYYDQRKVQDIADDLKLHKRTITQKKRNIKLKFIEKFGYSI